MQISANGATPRGQRGFTLGEVLTTLGVLGVSLSLAVPSFDRAAQSNLRATAINELVATLHLARSEALARNASIAVCPSADGQTCAPVAWEAGWIRFVDSNGNYRADDGEAVLGGAPAIAGLEIRTAKFATAFAYGPTGRVSAPDSSATGGDFMFCGTARGLTPQVVLISALGHPVLAGQRADGRPADCDTA
ncbi:MAG: GspH/FimT family pseudopilin [Chromatiales bacterium]|nr:GspH/FimT family pseudopilin [Chromatiales bacterium]